MERNLHHQHADVAERIPDAVDVVLDARHQLTGARLVKKVGGQRLNVSE